MLKPQFSCVAESANGSGDSSPERVAVQAKVLRSMGLRAQAYAHHEKTVNDPKVAAALQDAMEKTSHLRQTVRAGNLVFAPMQAPSTGDTSMYDAYQVSKSEIFENNTVSS